MMAKRRPTLAERISLRYVAARRSQSVMDDIHHIRAELRRLARQVRGLKRNDKTACWHGDYAKACDDVLDAIKEAKRCEEI